MSFFRRRHHASPEAWIMVHHTSEKRSGKVHYCPFREKRGADLVYLLWFTMYYIICLLMILSAVEWWGASTNQPVGKGHLWASSHLLQLSTSLTSLLPLPHTGHHYTLPGPSRQLPGTKFEMPWPSTNARQSGACVQCGSVGFRSAHWAKRRHKTKAGKGRNMSQHVATCRNMGGWIYPSA